ncbi:MAG: DUF4402 domain-containing protein [Balneolaceae bacterium]
MALPAAHAQQRLDASVSIQVSANVVDPAEEAEIEVVTARGMDLRGASQEANIITVDPTLSFRAGKLVASGEPGASFRISYLPTRELSNVEGTGFLFFEYDVSGNNVDEQDTSELFEAETPPLQFNQDGDFYIWVGGRIDLANAAPGTYEGEFTLEIEYI